MSENTKSPNADRAGRPRRIPVPFAVISLSMVSLTIYLACQNVDEHEVPVAELPLREVMGLAPDYIVDLQARDRASVQRRVVDNGEAQEGWLSNWVDAASTFTEGSFEPPYDRIPDDPLNSMLRFDQRRAEFNEEVWLFGIHVQDDAGVRVFGCSPDLEVGELGPPPPAADADSVLPMSARPTMEYSKSFPEPWVEFVGFDKTSMDEMEWLMALSGGLESWRLRCIEQAELPVRVDPLRIVRQQGAPFALAYWPQRRSLYVNPALLALWRPESEASPTSLLTSNSALEVEEYGTCAQSSAYLTVDQCVNALNCVCDRCTLEYMTATPGDATCTSPLFANTPIHQDCSGLRAMDGGVLRYCVREIITQKPSVGTCVNNSGFGESCGTVGVGGIADVKQLEGAYTGFVWSSTESMCLEVLLNCMKDNAELIVEAEPKPGKANGAPDNCEHDCWHFCLNDTYCNDLGGTLCFSDLFWVDPDRPGLDEVVCGEDQPTHVCGEDKK